MKKLSSRPQRTISRTVKVHGVGYITGANICLKFVPAPPSTGIVFVRTDLKPAVQIPAVGSQITGTNRRTTLGHMPRCVTLVEHVLAALAGLRIDNCFVELNGMEPPGLDGSARGFVDILHEATIVSQPATRTIWAPTETLTVRQEGASLSLHPPTGSEFRISYILDYGRNSPILAQRHTVDITPESFVNEISQCRTYLLESEACELQRQGIGSRTRVSDLVVFGPQGPLENTLRFANEPARHKILDIVGDLSLAGQDIRGHVVAFRSGHPLNAALVHTILARMSEKRPVKKQAA